MTTRKAHWDTAHRSQPIEETGWFEPEPTPSLELIAATGVPHTATILDVGSGASTLMDHLLDAGYQSLIACDLSQVALDALASRLGDRGAAVRFVPGDILDPATTVAVGPVSIWHDRAMFHFLTVPEERARYVDVLKRSLEPGGFALMATFALDGAEKCSGLPVCRYDAAGIQSELGDEFELVHSRSLVFTQPSGGRRPFTYALFRRNENAP